jgi:hypothetical protein
MSIPCKTFFIDGPCEDPAYLNTRDHPRGVESKYFVEELWRRFYHLADPHFREDARTHFHQRFWEMYLAVTLLEHDFDLKRQGSEGPEFYAVLENKRLWFEAIAPGPGDGPDQVPPLRYDGQFHEFPTERVLLRFTNALDEKRRRYFSALSKGIIAEDDQYVLAINSRGIRHDTPYEKTMPLFIQACLPIGQLVVPFNVTTKEWEEAFYQRRPAITKLSGNSVSTGTFLDEAAKFCSVVLHSGVDCANYPSRLGGDFALLHNPSAQCPLDATAFEWCEQFSVRDARLHRLKPNLTVNTDAPEKERRLP